jgi:hypothetical protein
MARSRNIKPGFFRNEDLVELPYESRLLFIGLWTIADREGRLEDRPKRIKMELFPADSLDVDVCLNQLQAGGFILRYAVESDRYVQVLAFSKHQNPHQKEQPSTIPAPPTSETGEESTGHAPVNSGADTGQAGLDSLNTDSLNTDSLNTDSGGREAPIGAAAPARDSAENSDVEGSIDESDDAHPVSGDANDLTIPADFAITPEMRQRANDQGYSDQEVDAFTESFRFLYGSKITDIDNWYGFWTSEFRKAMERSGA